jgi:hypothetical protein
MPFAAGAIGKSYYYHYSNHLLLGLRRDFKALISHLGRIEIHRQIFPASIRETI